MFVDFIMIRAKVVELIYILAYAVFRFQSLKVRKPGSLYYRYYYTVLL